MPYRGLLVARTTHAALLAGNPPWVSQVLAAPKPACISPPALQPQVTIGKANSQDLASAVRLCGAAAAAGLGGRTTARFFARRLLGLLSDDVGALHDLRQLKQLDVLGQPPEVLD